MENPPSNGKPIKWKKLAAQELQRAERIPLKNLQKQFLQEQGNNGRNKPHMNFWHESRVAHSS